MDGLIVLGMSPIGPKADITGATRNIRFRKEFDWKNADFVYSIYRGGGWVNPWRMFRPRTGSNLIQRFFSVGRKFRRSIIRSCRAHHFGSGKRLLFESLTHATKCRRRKRHVKTSNYFSGGMIRLASFGK
jgi:hypothetical protein